MTKSPWYIDEDIAVAETLVPAGFANIEVYHTYCADLIDVLFAAAMETDPSWVKGEEPGTLARSGKTGPRSPQPLQKWYERICPRHAEVLAEIVRQVVHRKHGLVAPPLT